MILSDMDTLMSFKCCTGYFNTLRTLIFYIALKESSRTEVSDLASKVRQIRDKILRSVFSTSWLGTSAPKLTSLIEKKRERCEFQQEASWSWAVKTSNTVNVQLPETTNTDLLQMETWSQPIERFKFIIKTGWRERVKNKWLKGRANRSLDI